jgi:hypothetical protein
MKSRKRVWIASLCLLLAAVITFTLKARLHSVQAASTTVQVTRAMSTPPVAHLATLRATAGRTAMMMMDEDEGATSVSGNLLNGRVIFPQVEEFTLTPPNPAAGIDQTTLTVRFPEAQARTLAREIPIQLGSQNVVLQRSADDPSTLVTSFDFDWQKFAQEQGERKVAASQGRTVPVFDGRRFVRTERIQFVEPAQIRQALQLHQPIHFQPQVLEGSAQINVFPDHQLMMTNVAIVNDIGGGGNPARTFDQCLPVGAQGSPTGAWTFNTLMMAIAGLTPTQNPQPAEQMVLNMLNNWNSTQTINTFQVLPRNVIPGGAQNMGKLNNLQGTGGTGFLSFWPIDPNTSCTLNNQPSTCPSLTLAPMMLDAIVNRIDVGANGAPFTPAGELRFVFTSTSEIPSDGPSNPGPCSNQNGIQEVFNMILEYHVPSNISALTWAGEWNNLQTTFTGDAFPEPYLQALNAMTNQVVLPNVCSDSNGHPISCISQVRANEILLSPGTKNADFWELREFHFSNSSGSPVLAEATVAQTPDPSFNTTGTPACGTTNNGNCAPQGTLGGYISFIALNPIFIATHGAAPPVPTNLSSGAPFLGGSALNNQAFWIDTNINNNPNDGARIDFSVNTCSGCHGREARTLFFQHVIRRPDTQESGLSFFLAGNPLCSTSLVNMVNGNPNGCTETVTDPNPAFPTVTTQFGDLLRRVTYLQTVCGNGSCTGGPGADLLMPFENKPIGVH